MSKLLLWILTHVVKIVEVLIALMLTIGLFFYCVKIPPVINDVLYGVDDRVEFELLLSHVFTLVIGIEFVKMIIRPTTNTVVEVLMFAIARTMIIDHSTGLDVFLGTLAVAVLFATRKYLFCDFDINKEKDSQPMEFAWSRFFQRESPPHPTQESGEKPSADS